MSGQVRNDGLHTCGLTACRYLKLPLCPSLFTENPSHAPYMYGHVTDRNPPGKRAEVKLGEHEELMRGNGQLLGQNGKPG